MTDGLRTVRLCFLGFGGVARAFCELLYTQEHALADRHRLRVLVTAAGTRHGSLLAPEGLSLAEVLERTGTGSRARAPVRLPEAPQPAEELMAGSRADVLVELTVVEEDGAPLSTGHVETALDLGMDVITANKGPIAWNWQRIAAKARQAGRTIRFESAVMDGLPVFGLLEFALPDCRLLGCEAVFNATTNFILDALGEGRSFDEALARAQADGYAEADPRHDIDGWDAACKGAALANVAMDADVTPADFERESLREVPRERILRARAAGTRLRMVTSVSREGGPGLNDTAEGPGAASPAGLVRGQVRAVELDIDHPLASVRGDGLGAILRTDLMGDIVIYERRGRLPQAAYGLYADLLHVCLPA